MRLLPDVPLGGAQPSLAAHPATAVDDDWLSCYRGGPAMADESADEWIRRSGDLRPAAAPIVRALVTSTPESRERLAWSARQRIDELGITYHVYGDPAGTQRPWPMDAIPAALDAGEWAVIEAGVIQRARVLEALLVDLYGAQDLVTQGLVPARFLYAQTTFLHAVRRQSRSSREPPIVGRDFPMLWFYAADLARGVDDTFVVLGDRTQAPSGAGYADQNRSVSARLWADLLDEVAPRSLDDAFASWAAGLRAARASAVAAPADALAVLLSPGPRNEAWFEHVQMARRLGLVLVQGEDLLFHGGQIWLRTLDRLEPVGLIVRRVDDAWSDALALRPDSLVGVPGLLEAEHRGTVRVVNALGSGLLEAPGWSVFLDRIASAWLGESLQLPDVPSWWCGETSSLERVLDTLPQLVLRSIWQPERFAPVFGASLDAEERAVWQERLRAHPERFVAQEHVVLASFPSLGEGGSIEPRRGALRVFAGRGALPARASGTPSMGPGAAPPGTAVRAASPGAAAGSGSEHGRRDGWVVLPTALVRVAGSVGSTVVSNQEGGVSKDVWVVETGSDAAGTAQPATRRTPRPMRPTDVAVTVLSRRVADRFFWLGRYAERLESSVRWLRLLLRRLQGVPLGRLGADQRLGDWDPLLPILAEGLARLTGRNWMPADPGASESLDPARPDWRIGLQQTLVETLDEGFAAMEGNVHALRDRLSGEMLSGVARLRRQMTAIATFGDALADSSDLDAAQLFRMERRLETVSDLLAALSGLSQESMLRHAGWRFLDAGRRIERSRNLLVLVPGLLHIAAAAGPEPDRGPEGSGANGAATLAGTRDLLLQFTESLAAVRSRGGGPFHRDADGTDSGLASQDWPAFFDALILEPQNPRGLLFQLERLTEHTMTLVGVDGSGRWSTLQRLAETPCVALRTVDSNTWNEPLSDAVKSFLATRLADVDRLHDAIFARFLAPAPLHANSAGPGLAGLPPRAVNSGL